LFLKEYSPDVSFSPPSSLVFAILFYFFTTIQVSKAARGFGFSGSGFHSLAGRCGRHRLAMSVREAGGVLNGALVLRCTILCCALKNSL